MTKRMLRMFTLLALEMSLFITLYFLTRWALEQIFHRKFYLISMMISMATVYLAGTKFGSGYLTQAMPRRILVIGNVNGFVPLLGFDVRVTQTLEDAERALTEFNPDLIDINEVFDLIEDRPIIKERFAKTKAEIIFREVDSVPWGMTYQTV